MPNTTPVVINAAPDFQAAIPPNLVPIYADLGLPDATCALFESGAIRLLAEPVAAMARLSGHARVLIAGCRRGDGASTVAGALALDLALRLGVDTLLAGAEREYPETRTGANGRPLRIGPSGVTHLSVARWAKIPDPARAPRMPLNDERSDPAEIIEELEASMGRYRSGDRPGGRAPGCADARHDAGRGSGAGSHALWLQPSRRTGGNLGGHRDGPSQRRRRDSE